jgi:hypothetical protein
MQQTMPLNRQEELAFRFQSTHKHTHTHTNIHLPTLILILRSTVLCPQTSRRHVHAQECAGLIERLWRLIIQKPQ